MGVAKGEIDLREMRAYLNTEVQKQVTQIVTMLQYIGQDVVNKIRSEHISDWTDQTGNLRSSIGYVVAVDGRPISESDFAQIDGPKRGTKEDPGYDASESLGFAKQVASQYTQGIALVVVAGMEYASYVERRDNKVVLAQGEIEIRKQIDQMVQKLNNALNSGR